MLNQDKNSNLIYVPWTSKIHYRIKYKYKIHDTHFIYYLSMST